ncbi:MAG: glyoxalase/bleomycin resistance/extradiol dioxygenase family protein [Rhizobacter sp.]
MTTNSQIFINLPVKDLPRSRVFFEALGYHFNPQFSDENGACCVISEHIYAMLLTEAYFKTFTPKQITDATQRIETLITLSCESREQVDELVAKAVAAGGKADVVQDYGFMYSHGFEDLDGHGWGLVYMVPAATPNT